MADRKKKSSSTKTQKKATKTKSDLKKDRKQREATRAKRDANSVTKRLSLRVSKTNQNQISKAIEREEHKVENDLRLNRSKELRAKSNKFNFRVIQMEMNDDDDTKVEEKQNKFQFEEKMDLNVPKSVTNESCFKELKHEGNGAQESECNVFPISMIDEDDTVIIPFTLDININQFCDGNNLDEFLTELSNILNMRESTLNGLCVSKGSSIIWVKIKNMTKEALQSMIDIFIKPKQSVSTFINKFKLNINKTISIKAKTFKHSITKFTKKKSRKKDKKMIKNKELNSFMTAHVDKLYPLIYDSLKLCHHDFQIIDCMVLDVPKRIDAFRQHANCKESKLLFHGTNTQHFASII
eukprot:250484_1